MAWTSKVKKMATLKDTERKVSWGARIMILYFSLTTHSNTANATKYIKVQMQSPSDSVNKETKGCQATTNAPLRVLASCVTSAHTRSFQATSCAPGFIVFWAGLASSSQRAPGEDRYRLVQEGRRQQGVLEACQCLSLLPLLQDGSSTTGWVITSLAVLQFSLLPIDGLQRQQ